MLSVKGQIIDTLGVVGPSVLVSYSSCICFYNHLKWKHHSQLPGCAGTGHGPSLAFGLPFAKPLVYTTENYIDYKEFSTFISVLLLILRAFEMYYNENNLQV